MGETEEKTVDQEALGKKELLTAAEAVALGYFRSVQAAAMLRYREQGPPFIQEDYGTRTLYRRVDLERWAERFRYVPRESEETDCG